MNQIRDVFNTAYTSFLACRIESYIALNPERFAKKQAKGSNTTNNNNTNNNNSNTPNADTTTNNNSNSNNNNNSDGNEKKEPLVRPQVVIHTGNWGTGAVTTYSISIAVD